MSEPLVPEPDRPAPEPAVLVRVEHVGKRYPGVVALADVSLTIRHGEVHALLGGNGAGKSTLIGILSGVTSPDTGTVTVDGTAVTMRTPKDAQGLGITTIHQELSLAPDLTVLQNIFLGREPRRGFRLDERGMRSRALALCGEFGLTPADLDRATGTLGALKQHVVEILKALVFDARLVVLDEPTSGLEDHERDMLFRHMRALRDRGVSILWVTHRLDELYGLADTITVLRDGRQVAIVDPGTTTPDDLVRLMVGGRADSLGDLATRGSGRTTGWTGPAEDVLVLDSVCRTGVLRDIDLTLRRGEVLGVAGIAGAGRTELARAILGADRIDHGTVAVRGRTVRIRSPRDAYRLGIALVPEERKTQSILGDFAIAKNISVSDLGRTSRAGVLIDRRRERAVARDYVRELGVRTPGIHQKIRNLSGGNQQKVIVARCLFTDPAVLIFDEPTQGIDVAAKAEVYRLIYDFVDAGGAAIVISSELPELLRVSDRILVMREGRIAGEVPGSARTDDHDDDRKSARIMALAARGVAS
jgi:ribose transport system ATP-binding protein